jgi:hypothetical protein
MIILRTVSTMAHDLQDAASEGDGGVVQARRRVRWVWEWVSLAKDFINPEGGGKWTTVTTKVGPYLYHPQYLLIDKESYEMCAVLRTLGMFHPNRDLCPSNRGGARRPEFPSCLMPRPPKYVLGTTPGTCHGLPFQQWGGQTSLRRRVMGYGEWTSGEIKICCAYGAETAIG